MRWFRLPKSACSLARPMCLRFSGATRFPRRLLDMYVQFCGDIGLRPWMRNGASATGGGVSFLAFMRRNCLFYRTEGSLWFNGLTLFRCTTDSLEDDR